MRVFARVDDPVRAEGVTVALDDHQCEFSDNSDSGDEPTLDLDLIFHVTNDASARALIHPDRISLLLNGQAYQADAASRDLYLRPRSQRDVHAHFSYEGDISCISNMAVSLGHVVQLEGKDLAMHGLTFQPSDQDAD